MKSEQDLLKEKKIKTMNNEMTINAYLSTMDLNTKLSKQAEQKQKHRCAGRFDGRHIGAGMTEIGEKVVTEELWGCKVRCRKWRSQRTYRHDQQTGTMVWELPETVGVLGGAVQREKPWGNCKNITINYN